MRTPWDTHHITFFKTKCCAILEISNLSRFVDYFPRQVGGQPVCYPAEVISSIKDQMLDARHHQWKKRQPFIMFTQATDRHISAYGDVFAEYIKTKGLGNVTATPPALNWTNKFVTVFLWEVSYPVLETWEITDDERYVAPETRGEVRSEF